MSVMTSDFIQKFYCHHDETGRRACTSMVLPGPQPTSLLADQLTAQMYGHYSVARSNADDSIQYARYGGDGALDSLLEIVYCLYAVVEPSFSLTFSHRYGNT